MSYSIVQYIPEHYANTDYLQPITDEKGNTLTFDTIEIAREWITDNENYDSEYYIADTDLIEWIGRDGDDSRYNWDNCSCGCGECDTCHQYRVIQDLEMIKKAAV